MSWSYKITILYLGFMAIILTLVTISFRNKEELVAADYYSQELNYQKKIEAINNTNALDKSISHEVNENSIILLLPANFKSDEVTGEVYFFCPSNSKFDIKIKLKFDGDGKQIISKSILTPSAYKMHLSWASKEKNYFKEEVINIK